MARFGLRSSSQLKALYLDALVEKGHAAGIQGRPGRPAGDGSKSKKILVNKRGSLIVPKPMVEEMGFKVGDVFTVSKSNSGVSLKRAKD